MKNIRSDGRYRSVPNSQEPAVVKEEITYESALRAEGIDEVFVAKKLKELLRAQGRRWNPKKGSWEKFEDYVTQLAALREIAKILGLYARDSEDAHMPTTINISAIPFRRERVSDDEHTVGTAAGDGRQRREAAAKVPGIAPEVFSNGTTAKP
jgi:hypothetical protein